MRGCAQLSGSDKFNEGAAPCRAALRCAAELRIHSEVRMFCVICCKVLRRRVGRGRIYYSRRRRPGVGSSTLAGRNAYSHATHVSTPRPPLLQ